MTRQPPAAVFLVRVWWDEDQFRARVTCTPNVADDPAHTEIVHTADPAQVSERLLSWLQEITHLRPQHTDENPDQVGSTDR